MVVMEWPTAALTGITQDRLGIPSKCTVHAPQSATPQPNLVPFIPSTSRKTQSRGMSGETSSLCDLPLILSVIMASLDVLRLLPLEPRRYFLFSAAAMITAATSLGRDSIATWLVGSAVV